MCYRLICIDMHQGSSLLAIRYQYYGYNHVLIENKWSAMINRRSNIPGKYDKAITM